MSELKANENHFGTSTLIVHMEQPLYIFLNVNNSEQAFVEKKTQLNVLFLLLPPALLAGQ